MAEEAKCWISKQKCYAAFVRQNITGGEHTVTNYIPDRYVSVHSFTLVQPVETGREALESRIHTDPTTDFVD